MEQKPDRRVVKTKKAIRNAFAELLSEKDIDEITVRDIADKADINRKTFYNYYKGVYQLIDEIENEVVSSFEIAFTDIDYRRDMRDPSLIFEKLTKMLSGDLDFYGHLLRMKGNVHLVAKTARLLKEKTKSNLAARFELDPLVLDIIVDYSISGMLAVYQSWFNSDRSRSIDEISREVGKICFCGVTEMLK